ncbi:MFS transporter [Gordonibacter sp.]|uniref:MFS transporter n=1 Tax=Gordonibacter sp. TaxID=1968902 RepID=UPI002FC798F9
MQRRSKSVAGASRALFPMLLGCSFIASFVQSMVNVALPKMADEFSVTISNANWLIVGYMVVAAVSVMLAAFLLKRLGLRRVFFAGGAALVAGSGLASFAPDFLTLLGCRMLQAVGTGLFFPVVTSAIMANSPKENLGTGLALNSGIIAIGLAVSPVVSGLALTYFGRAAMFAVPCVLALVLLLAGFFLVRGAKGGVRVSVDPLSVVLGLVGLGALMYGLGEITHDFIPSIIALGVGVVGLILFVWRQLVLDSPLLNLRPLRSPRFSVGIVLIMVGTLISFSMSILLPLYYEGAAGYTAFFAGLLLLGPVLVNAVFTFIGGRLLDRYGIWPLLPAGLVVVLVGQAGVFFSAEGLMMVLVVAASALVYAGVGFVVAPSKTAALRQLPPDLSPHAASINSTAVQIASALGSSIFVGVLSADVLRDTAAGVTKTQAYAAGFTHTLIIAIGIAVAGLVLAFFYARALRRKGRR